MRFLLMPASSYGIDPKAASRPCKKGGLPPVPILTRRQLVLSVYIPPHFQESDTPALHAAMREIRFASLVSTVPSGLLVSHIPLLIETQPEPYGTLIGHFARPNPHWQEAAGAPVVAIFLGSNGYITPNWYATKPQTGKVVPTWNYIAVHAHGMLRSFDDVERLRGVVTALTVRHEERSQQPWHVADAPAEYVDSMLKGIVGIEIPIERIEGKFKLSQNRPSEDITGAIEGLRELGDAASLALARAMAQARPANQL